MAAIVTYFKTYISINHNLRMFRNVNLLHEDIDPYTVGKFENPRIVNSDNEIYLVHNGNTVLNFSGHETKPEIYHEVVGELHTETIQYCTKLIVSAVGNGLTARSGFAYRGPEEFWGARKKKRSRFFKDEHGLTIQVIEVYLLSDTDKHVVYMGIWNSYVLHRNSPQSPADYDSNVSVWQVDSRIVYVKKSFDVHVLRELKVDERSIWFMNNSGVKVILDMDTCISYNVPLSANQPLTEDETILQVDPDDPVVAGTMALFGHNYKRVFLTQSGILKRTDGKSSQVCPLFQFKRGKVGLFYSEEYSIVYIVSVSDDDGSIDIRSVFKPFVERVVDMRWSLHDGEHADRTVRILYGDDETKDMKLSTMDGNVVLAHSKVMFAMEGSVFESDMLRREFEMTGNGECRLFETMEISYEVATFIVQYCYFGSFPKFDTSKTALMIQIMVAAHACCLTGIVEHLAHLMRRHLDDLDVDDWIVLCNTCRVLRPTLIPMIANKGDEYAWALEDIHL